jgi:hypothetical protein
MLREPGEADIQTGHIWASSLVPDDAQQAIGHGVRAKRSKSGAISFDILNVEDSRTAVE